MGSKSERIHKKYENQINSLIGENNNLKGSYDLLLREYKNIKKFKYANVPSNELHMIKRMCIENSSEILDKYPKDMSEKVGMILNDVIAELKDRDYNVNFDWDEKQGSWCRVL